VTDFRMSMTTLEIDAPHVRAAQLIARPGTLPTIAIPMTSSSVPDVEGIWRHLGEAAEFFGVRMPGLPDLTAALTAFAATATRGGWPALIAANATIAETDGGPLVLVTGSAVQPMRREPVRIDGSRPMLPAPRPTDPWWRRMAARTTSRAEEDRCERWLNGRGYADGVSEGLPVLGALVFEADGDVVGVENPEPTSILDQLAQCGAIARVERATGWPADADRVWWVSPGYQTRPVAELDGRRWAVVPDAVPPFARWS
jgi:hypothetical protein